jgi:hypothetical protein
VFLRAMRALATGFVVDTRCALLAMSRAMWGCLNLCSPWGEEEMDGEYVVNFGDKRLSDRGGSKLGLAIKF